MRVLAIYLVPMRNSPNRRKLRSTLGVNGQKDVQYSSRIASRIASTSKRIACAMSSISFTARLPGAQRNNAMVRELTSYGCPTRMRILGAKEPQIGLDLGEERLDFRNARSDPD